MATRRARSTAAGNPSGSITVQLAFIIGAAMAVGPALWLTSRLILPAKLPVSPAKVITTTGRLPVHTLIS